MTIVVRPARLGDVDDVVEVALEAWREGYRGVVPPNLMPDPRGLRARMLRIASRPLAPGIEMSSTTTSGSCALNAP